MSTKYREVSRKANAGERIRIVNAKDRRYKNGEEFAVEFVDKLDDVFVKHPLGTHDGCALILESEYVVLEPVESANFPELLAQFLRENAAAVRKYLDEIDPPAPILELETDGRVTVNGAHVSKPEAPLTRADVIAKAKADVAELERIGGDTKSDLPKGTPFHDYVYIVEFYVNREKRAVTALVRKGRNLRRRPDAKATAKASPDDVFHAEIGKAISLRRALGLPVTAEYINAPKPTPASGAVVVYHSSWGGDIRTTLTKRVPQRDGSARYGDYAFRHTAIVGWIADKQYDIIDDTDVDYERSAA